MRKIFAVIIFMAVFASVCWADSVISEDRAYFPAVLMYHDLKVKPLNEFDTTPESFASQLDRLKDNGYETLSAEDFTAYLRKGEGFPEKSVVITFDDGYNGVYDYALPELKKRGMKAIFFIILSTIGVVEGTTYPHITIKQLLEISEGDTISIGSHTITHPHLDQLPPEVKALEITQSKKILEGITGRKINLIAYPYGDYDGAVIEAVKSAGYEAAFAVQDRGFFGHEARYSIPRIYTGLELAENDNALFREFVKNYKAMPAEAFKERFKPID